MHDAGGSAGIGKAAAHQFDANGCHIAVLGRRLERLDAVVRHPFTAWLLVLQRCKQHNCTCHKHIRNSDVQVETLKQTHISYVLSQSKQLKHGVSIVADLTKEDDMKRAVKEAIEKLGGLDILVNRWVPGCRPTTKANLALYHQASSAVLKNPLWGLLVLWHWGRVMIGSLLPGAVAESPQKK